MTMTRARSESPYENALILSAVKESKERTSAIARRSSSAHRRPKFERNTSADTGSWENLLREVIVRFQKTYRALLYTVLTYNSNGANTTSVTDHTASTNATQYTPRPATKHLPGTIIVPLASCSSDPDNKNSACCLDCSTEYAIPTSATGCLSKETGSAFDHPWSVPAT
jgi:hypothetical protein